MLISSKSVALNFSAVWGKPMLINRTEQQSSN